MRHRRWWAPALVPALLVAVGLSVAGLLAAGADPKAGGDVTAQVRSLAMFSGGKWAAHYQVPKDQHVVGLLQDRGIPLHNAKAREKAVAAFRQEWVERNPTTPNPKKLRKLLKNERAGEPKLVTGADFKSLIVPMEFNPDEETFVGSEGTDVTFAGPLHNEIPAPGPRDNNTVWYEDTSTALYDELYFGQGPDAGVVVDHPNLGEVDLRGYTMANFYLEQSEGAFVPTGEVYPKWLRAAHAEAWYGADNEVGGDNSNVRADELVREAVDAVNADDADFDWEVYDGDGDGVVDNFTVIHAGMGQEAGGGDQGDYAIWSHASVVDYPTGYLAQAKDSISPGVPSRDIYVREYSMDPENIDVGVICEEYGHAAFGLPDIYTTDLQASPSNWAIMESGSWNGVLGGMQPAPFPLYFRYLIGWADPVEVSYDGIKPTVEKVGQLSLRPDDTQQGIKIDLPDQVVETPNLAGTGTAWWSTRSDLADFFLARDFDLTDAVAPVLSFASYWSMEEGYDFSYVEASTDDGGTWTALGDMDGFMVDDGSGTMALNGEGQGVLRFDLSAYAGGAVTVRLHYVSDMAVQWAGWWADDFALTDGDGEPWSDDVESGADDWDTDAFVFVPKTDTYPLYYLAEWRNDSGFDRGLKYPYLTLYSDEDEWEVDRAPYTVPGMVLWLRNGAYDFDYTLYDGSFFESPSWGPKHALLVVDSHYWPLTWDDYAEDSGVPLRVGERVQPSNAAFTLQKTTPFTLRLGYDPDTGEWLPQDEPAETKRFASQPAVSQFHDSLGYYPGLWYNIDPDPDLGGLWLWDAAASLVVPAEGDYTTRITWADKKPADYLYGYDMGDTVLGSGDPRDSGVQHGVNIAVLSQARNGSWGRIAVWNAKRLAKVSLARDRAKARRGQTVRYTIKVKALGPAAQPFRVVDPLPKGTTFVGGAHYSKAAKAVVWKGSVAAGKAKTLVFWVKVKKGIKRGTVIKNTATLHDDANGSAATVKVKVK